MAKKQNPQILSPENYIRQRARNLPIFKCYINEGWDEGGMAQVTIARRHVNGNITYCSYLVDLQCLGIKDTLFDFNIPKEHFNVVLDKMSEVYELVEADYALVHNIIHAGWEFADEIGFKPHKDFHSITQYMLEEDNDTIPIIEINCGDKDGKPFYVQGPFEVEATVNRIINTLEKNVGAGNYHYILEGDDSPFDDWDEEEEDDEDYDDDAYEDDEDYDEEDDEEIFFREYAENSYEENVTIFLDLSQYLDEMDPDEVDEDEDEDEDGKNDENFTRLLALAEILYREIIPVEEFVLWEERWEEEAFLYSISEDAVPEMLGLRDKSSLTQKDIAYIRRESDNNKLEKYLRKKGGDLPYLSVMEIQEIDDSTLKSEKIAAALARFPDYGLLKLEDITNRIPEHSLKEEELLYASVFGSREKITPAEYAMLQILRLSYFVMEANFAGLESLYFSILDEIDFEEEDLDEHFGVLLSIFQAMRISLLRDYLLSQTQE